MASFWPGLPDLNRNLGTPTLKNRAARSSIPAASLRPHIPQMRSLLLAWNSWPSLFTLQVVVMPAEDVVYLLLSPRQPGGRAPSSASTSRPWTCGEGNPGRRRRPYTDTPSWRSYISRAHRVWNCRVVLAVASNPSHSRQDCPWAKVGARSQCVQRICLQTRA